MTIKEFAALCGCTTQTLRYYDKIDLLKPVQVDSWSGYRYYAPEQALDFVKIKNLQAADFTIEEIKTLLTQSDEQVYDAFSVKLAEQQEKLERIREIQQSYLTEKMTMKKTIQAMVHGLSEYLGSTLTDYEMLWEFGLEPEDGPKAVECFKAFFEEKMCEGAGEVKNITLVVDDEEFHGNDIGHIILELDKDELPETIVLADEKHVKEVGFHPEQHVTVWERRGWEHIYEFLDDIPTMEERESYTFLFRLNEASYREDLAIPVYMAGAMMLKKREMCLCEGFSVDRSEDGENYFALLKRKK